jgi:ElaA protein
MEISIKHYEDLSKDEFHDLIALRISVFVVEQDCPYQELDGLDKDAYHVLIKENDEIIGTARILKAGVAYPEVAIGRVVSGSEHRDKKIGYLLMEAAMKFVKEEFKEKSIRLSAQTHLLAFYQKVGFQSTGKEYLEDGIPHTEMIYRRS